MSVPRHVLPAVAVATLAALALSSCVAATATSGGQRIEGGTVVYAHQQEPACIFGGWIEQSYISYNVLDALVALDDDGTVVPWLAEAWEQSEDGLSWTFRLKPDVLFTDGTPVDAEAVAYNFDHWVGGGNSTARVWLLGYYDSAEVVDDLTVRIHLSAPYPRLADNLTQGYFGIQSQHALETRSAEDNCAQPIGSGAFTVEEWRRGERIVLARNDDYTSWPANALHEGPAYVEKVEWRIVPDPTTRVAALQSGEVDAIYDVPAVQWETLEGQGFELAKYVTPGRPQQLSFDSVDGPFTDVRVRQAFAYSLDRRTIVETVGRGVIPYEGNGAVSQSTPGYSQEAADRYDYDPERARELLDDAGWVEGADGVRVRDGERLEVKLPYGAGTIINADGSVILQGVQEQAGAVGFDVELVPVPPAEWFSGVYTTPEERDIAAGYWTSVTAGILYINWRPSTPELPNNSNSAFYDDEQLAAIILAANSEPDLGRQNELYREAQEYIADRALSIGLYTRLSTLAVGPRLHDLRQENAQGGPTFHDVYLTE